MRKKILSILFFFISIPLWSQTELGGSDNYALKENGDTVRGFIEEIGESRITVASIVRNEYRVQRLSTKTVVEYHLNDTIYRRISINLNESIDREQLISMKLTAKIFLKLLIDGPAALYERNVKRIKLMDPSMNSDAKGFLHKVPERQLFLHFDEELPALLINELNFYDVSMLALGKKERIRKRLNSGYYTFDNMNQMLLDYNYLVENNID